jgi:hypothetical protein
MCQRRITLLVHESPSRTISPVKNANAFPNDESREVLLMWDCPDVSPTRMNNRCFLNYAEVHFSKHNRFLDAERQFGEFFGVVMSQLGHSRYLSIFGSQHLLDSDLGRPFDLAFESNGGP